MSEYANYYDEALYRQLRGLVQRGLGTEKEETDDQVRRQIFETISQSVKEKYIHVFLSVYIVYIKFFHCENPLLRFILL